MYIVPIKGDRLELRGQDVLSIASSYTGYKESPAVYIRAPLADGSRSVPFSDILKINDVPVTLDENSNCLKAHAKVKRKFDLPQPGDTVTYIFEHPNGNEEEVEAEIKLVRLHGQENRAFMMKTVTDVWLSITDIVKTSGRFDRAKFQTYYLDYSTV